MDFQSRHFHFVITLSVGLLRKGLSHPITFDMELMNYLVFLIPAFTYFKEIFTFQQEGDLLKDFTFWSLRHHCSFSLQPLYPGWAFIICLP
jgi:hypothetical protein